MLIEIKSWVDDTVLHTIEADSIKAAVEALVRQGKSLDGAELNYAELNYAELNYAELNGAKLNYAKLNGAKLNYAKLNGAKLNGAKLNGAELDGAKLNYAKLNDAELNYAKLNDAKLNGAELNGTIIDDLNCLSELSDAIDLAPMIFAEWQGRGIVAAKKRFGLYIVHGEDRALIAMCPQLVGGFAFILGRREIWWWQWLCPRSETVPVLWREEGQ